MTDIYDQAVDEVRRDHKTTWTDMGWRCSCGAGTWGTLMGMSRANAAAATHRRSQWRKAADRLKHADA